MFVQSPAFNTAIVSVVNAVLLKPLPFPDPDRIVYFMNVGTQGSNPAASPAKFQHYLEQARVAGDISAFNQGVVSYTDGSFPEQLRSGRVSADFFRLFGAQTLFGRTFTGEEDRPGGDRVAVLGRGFWETRFSGDPEILGQAISIGGAPYTVIGVLGDFDFDDFGGQSPQIWLPSVTRVGHRTHPRHAFRATDRANAVC